MHVPFSQHIWQGDCDSGSMKLCSGTKSARRARCFKKDPNLRCPGRFTTKQKNNCSRRHPGTHTQIMFGRLLFCQSWVEALAAMKKYALMRYHALKAASPACLSCLKNSWQDLSTLMTSPEPSTASSRSHWAPPDVAR